MGVPSETLKIFLVENHQDTLVYLTRYLEQRGYQVQSARNMQSALEALAVSLPDVLICDIGLPDGDGWELMRRLGEIRSLPFGIAMSGFGMKSDREKSLSAGFKHHLIKPFMPEDLDGLLAEAGSGKN